MRIALELNDTECRVLIDSLEEKIQRMEEYKDTHEEDWDAFDKAELLYKIALINKIRKFSDLQETLEEED